MDDGSIDLAREQSRDKEKRAMAVPMGGRAPESLAAYACVLQAYEYRRLMTLAGLPAVRACLQRAVREEPEYADAGPVSAFRPSGRSWLVIRHAKPSVQMSLARAVV